MSDSETETFSARPPQRVLSARDASPYLTAVPVWTASAPAPDPDSDSDLEPVEEPARRAAEIEPLSDSSDGEAEPTVSDPAPSVAAPAPAPEPVATAPPVLAVPAAVYAPPPPPPPPPARDPPRYFRPYKMAVQPGCMTVHARSECGTERQKFEIDVDAWAYIDLSGARAALAGAPDDDARKAVVDDCVRMLKKNLATDRVTFDNDTGYFVASPARNLTTVVREAAADVVVCEPTTYAVLNRYKRDFFSTFDGLQRRWAATDRPVAKSPESAARSLVRVCVAVPVYRDTIAFVLSHSYRAVDADRSLSRMGGQTRVWVFTANPLFAGAAESDIEHHILDGVTVCARYFAGTAELAAGVEHYLASETDILVHYGESQALADLGHPLAAGLGAGAGAPESHLELFDLRGYIEDVYTDLPTYDLKTAAKSIDLSGWPEARARIVERAMDALSETSAGPDDTFLPASLEGMDITSENIAFVLSRVGVQAFVTSHLYHTLSMSLFQYMNWGGVSLADLTRPGALARGAVFRHSPVAALSSSAPERVLPRDFMSPPVAIGMCYVTALSTLLVDQLEAAESPIARAVGADFRRMNAGTCGRAVREAYSLLGVGAPAVVYPPEVFGVYRNMLYSSAEIAPEHELVRKWSAIIAVGLSSWICVYCMIQNPADPAAFADSSSLLSQNMEFSYFGLDEACQHACPAVRKALQTYLSINLNMESGSKQVNAHAAASSVQLTSENMRMRQRVTQSNATSFNGMLSDSELDELAAGGELEISLWVGAEGHLTRNRYMAKPHEYVEYIRRLIESSFAKLEVSRRAIGATRSSAAAAAAIEAAAATEARSPRRARAAAADRRRRAILGTAVRVDARSDDALFGG